jgi:hypothetical protein
MKKSLALLLLPLSFIAAAGRAESATTNASGRPVVIAAATVISLPPAIQGENGVRYGFTGVDGVAVTFVNTSSIAAREVLLRATYGDETRYIRDRGTFAPNVTIEHNYTAFSNQPYRGDAVVVTVAGVTFSDGTTWTGPAFPWLRQDH